MVLKIFFQFPFLKVGALALQEVEIHAEFGRKYIEGDRPEPEEVATMHISLSSTRIEVASTPAKLVTPRKSRGSPHSPNVE